MPTQEDAGQGASQAQERLVAEDWRFRANAHVRRAVGLLDAGLLDDALAHLHKAIDEDRGNWEARLRLAGLERDVHEFGRGLALYARDFRPEHFETVFRLAAQLSDGPAPRIGAAEKRALGALVVEHAGDLLSQPCLAEALAWIRAQTEERQFESCLRAVLEQIASRDSADEDWWRGISRLLDALCRCGQARAALSLALAALEGSDGPIAPLPGENPCERWLFGAVWASEIDSRLEAREGPKARRNRLRFLRVEPGWREELARCWGWVGRLPELSEDTRERISRELLDYYESWLPALQAPIVAEAFEQARSGLGGDRRPAAAALLGFGGALAVVAAWVPGSTAAALASAGGFLAWAAASCFVLWSGWTRAIRERWLEREAPFLSRLARDCEDAGTRLLSLEPPRPALNLPALALAVGRPSLLPPLLILAITASLFRNPAQDGFAASSQASKTPGRPSSLTHRPAGLDGAAQPMADALAPAPADIVPPGPELLAEIERRRLTLATGTEEFPVLERDFAWTADVVWREAKLALAKSWDIVEFDVADRQAGRLVSATVPRYGGARAARIRFAVAVARSGLESRVRVQGVCEVWTDRWSADPRPERCGRAFLEELERRLQAGAATTAAGAQPPSEPAAG